MLSNKYKGNFGLASAIYYFTKCGYTVSVPLNDTQDYDLVVDINGSLKKIQCKATNQKTEYNSTCVTLKSCGGTKDTVYKTVKDTNIDLLFIVNMEDKKWLIPIEDITQSSAMNLREDSIYRIF